MCVLSWGVSIYTTLGASQGRPGRSPLLNNNHNCMEGGQTMGNDLWVGPARKIDPAFNREMALLAEAINKWSPHVVGVASAPQRVPR